MFMIFFRSLRALSALVILFAFAAPKPSAQEPDSGAARDALRSGYGPTEHTRDADRGRTTSARRDAR